MYMYLYSVVHTKCSTVYLHVHTRILITNNGISCGEVISNVSPCCQVLIHGVGSPGGWLDQHLSKTVSTSFLKLSVILSPSYTCTIIAQ